jgi:hypothetical protein
MSTTRKKTPATRPAKKTTRRPRKPTTKGRVLGPEATDLFSLVDPAPVLSVTEADIVVDAIIPEPPRPVVVEEVDIVSESAAAPLSTALARRPVLALVAPSRPVAPPARSGLAWRGAAVLLVMVAATAASWARLHRPAGPPPLAAALPIDSPPAEPPTPQPALREQLRALGHAAFSAGEKTQALRNYERALAFDRGVVDAQMVANLLACYGQKRTQPTAAALIVRFQIVHAREGLIALVKAGRTRGTRLGARYTLEKLRGERPTSLS